MTTKRAYKLQEFVAHSSSVNCLKIGRKSSRLLVTGGEDHKVNLWAIGKPNAILSLSGHSSGIDSVNFDHSEVIVAAGAASGTVKLWDLEEAKLVRTLTGHRSNCISLDFHPFGEFFASGSLDTNLKIWDIRKKGCIHTYKGHTRGVNALRFTPDGRWIVSGGEDNTVKLWDLTAGKLLHDFKFHEGQVLSIDFHPHEFLLATGSADRTVKFWDLETFELIGSTSVESTGVRCLTFNPDGRTLLCGFHETLKVFSWEPVRCRDSVEVGWSKLSDLNVHEGKLLGCSYNQSCVGVWVVDIKQIAPYANGGSARRNVLTENSVKLSPGRSSTNSADLLSKEFKVSLSQNLDPRNSRESKPLIGSAPGTPLRGNPRTSGAPATKKCNPKITAPKEEFMPVIVPRASRVEQTGEGRRDNRAEQAVEVRSIAARTMPFSLRKSLSSREDTEVVCASPHASTASSLNRHYQNSAEASRGRPRQIVIELEKKERERETREEERSDPMAEILDPHDRFVSAMHSRLAKLQAVHRYWEKRDFKSVFTVIEKMADHAVAADVISSLSEQMSVVNLDICASVLPLLHFLLQSNLDRHTIIAIDVLLKLVRTFGSTIYAAKSAAAPVGVDIEAEQRMERYEQCFSELEKIKLLLPSLIKRSGTAAKAAHELNFALRDVY